MKIYLKNSKFRKKKFCKKFGYKMDQDLHVTQKLFYIVEEPVF